MLQFWVLNLIRQFQKSQTSAIESQTFEVSRECVLLLFSFIQPYRPRWAIHISRMHVKCTPPYETLTFSFARASVCTLKATLKSCGKDPSAWETKAPHRRPKPGVSNDGDHRNNGVFQKIQFRKVEQDLISVYSPVHGLHKIDYIKSFADPSRTHVKL